MSSEPSTPPPSTDALKEATEKLVSFFQWIAELVLAKNWVALLVLADFGAIFALSPNSGFVLKFLVDTLHLKLPNWYGSVFWFVVGLVFVAALVVAVKTAPRAKKLDVADTSTRRAIKGLRAFGVEDAEIFAKLQRNQSLQDCLESLSREEFRFGLLIAESGCGKTSFLQAGLLPKLLQPDASLRGVYIKFSDRPPLNTIRAELVEQLQLPKDKAEQVDFLGLLQMAVEAAQKPVVLMLDQFEQFFVHQPRKDDRQPFIQALTNWYCSAEALPIKIVVSIRADLMHELVEIQQALSYTLSRYELFKLEKFEPEEAAEILRVLAETEQLKFDKRFAEELTREELTTTEGKVSPVNLQIFAEVVRKQKLAEQRAFNREAFQKLGGIDGLLNRYLEETLEDLRLQGHNSLYQAALQVLLALTDRERNVRAGVLTVAELQDKLQGSVKPTDVITATRWLAASEVRLITPVEQNNTTGYELAHERIILALLRLAGKELKDADRANQLLERRVNEWLGNQKHHDYLLTWGELRFVERYKSQLVWGANKRVKEQLLQHSHQRWLQILGAVLTSLFLLLGGWLFWLSPPLQRWQMKGELLRASQRSTYDTRIEAVTVFAKNGNWDQVFEVSKSIKNDPRNNNQAINSVMKVVVKLRNFQTAKSVLGKLHNFTEAFEDEPSSRASILITMAEAYSKLNDPQSAKAVLQQARTAAEKSKDELANKPSAFIEIAEAYSKLNDLQSAEAVLQQAYTTAEALKGVFSRDALLESIVKSQCKVAEAYRNKGQLDNSRKILNQAHKSIEQISERTLALGKLAKLQAKLGDWKKAHDTAKKCNSEDCKVKVLAVVMTVWAEQQNPELIEKEDAEENIILLSRLEL